VAAKDGHGIEIACVNKDNSDDDKSVIAGASKPAWLQAAAAAAELNSGVSGTPRKKARGGEEQFPFRLDPARAYAAQSVKAKPPPIATKHDEPDDRTSQRPYGGHGKAEEPKAPAKGGHGHKITSRGKDGSDGDEIARGGATKPASLQALASAAIRGEVGARRGDGGAGMYPDDSVAAAARFVPGAKGRMPNTEARTALESLTGAEVVRKVLAALRDDTDEEEEQDNDNEEEPSGDGNDSGFVITQDDDSKDNETSGGEAPKVQQGSGREAHKQTHKEAPPLTDRGGGTLGLASDGEDEKTRNSKARPGSRAINKDRNTRAPEARQSSLASDASKSHQKTKEAAHHPAYWGSKTHRKASEGEDEKDWAPQPRRWKEGGVAPKIIGAPPPRVSAAQRAGPADLGVSGYRVSSNAEGPPLRNERQGASQADAGAGVGLAGVVTP
jgi:hypothetical protein